MDPLHHSIKQDVMHVSTISSHSENT